MRKVFLWLVAVAVFALALAIPLSGQTVLTAQILGFWRILQSGGTINTTTGELANFKDLLLIQNGYINFTAANTSNGYGIRDNNGTIEIKNNNGAWAAPSGGANPLGRFLVQTATGAPANAQIMGALGTGLVFNTTTTGVQSIYAGSTCTNQFVRALSAAGVGTCNTVSLVTDVTGALKAASFPALTGPVTTTAGSLVTSIAATGVGAGSVGSATSIPTFTVGADGRLTVKGSATPQLTLTSTYLSSLSAASLTGIPGANVTGTLATAAFPALTGDVTTAGASLATTVAKIGGNTVTLGGALTTSGANPVTFTTTGSTNVTLPTSGTLLSGTVTSLTSLSAVGTLVTGIWNATPITPQYGGTGLATVTAHGIVIGEGTSTMVALGGCTNGVLSWTASSVDPTCATAPTLATLGLTSGMTIGGTGAAGAAATSTKFTKLVTGISDATATPLVTVTVPNAVNGAVVHVRLVGSLGAGGAIGSFECSAALDGNVIITRTPGVATVATAASAAETASSCVAGATTVTLAYSVSAMTGAVGASQTFAIQGTVTKGGGSSANHQILLTVETTNSQVSGVTVL